jgi:hypothetical protein
VSDTTQPLAPYLDKEFFGWRSDAASWQGGKIHRDDDWVGFRAKQQLVFRYDPTSSLKMQFLSVQVLDTDIEATMMIPHPSTSDDFYHIAMAVDSDTQLTFSTASSVDVRYWEIQQNILHMKDDDALHN